MFNEFLKIFFSSYIVWIKKGYQNVEEPLGSSISKVKGIARVSIGNSNDNGMKIRE